MMNILIIGGTRFIGPFVVRQLYDAGHRVTVFNRGKSSADLPAGVERIKGDRNHITDFQEAFKKLNLDIVVDMVLITKQQAVSITDVFNGITKRVIGISSQDVYRAYGVMLGTETGDLQPTPLTENATLRSSLYPYRGKTPRPDDDPRKILDNYDKIPIEKTLLQSASFYSTILRLPMVYGPGDYQHRLYEYVKRMDDRRPVILLDQGFAAWKSSFGYVENVAHAICCAVQNETAQQNVYNVADAKNMTMEEWVKKIGETIGWNGNVVALPENALPEHLHPGFNTAQHLDGSTERIRSDLGFKEVVPLDQALTRTVAWERANPPEKLDPDLYDYQAEDRAYKAYRENN